MTLTEKLPPRVYGWSDRLHWVGNVTAQHARILIVPALIGLVLAARGCAAPQRLPVDDSLFARISMQPADDAIMAADLFHPNTGVLRYKIVSGDKSGDYLDFKRSPTDLHGAAWASAEGEVRTDFWSTDDNGNVQLKAVFDDQDNAVSLFDPPLTLPHQLRPGEPHREQAAIRVVDAKNPAVQKASGKATRTMEYIDNQRIRTPLGVLDAQRLVVHFLAEMGVATAETTSTYFIVPGLGMVAEETSERITILGVFGRSYDRTIVLVDDN